MSKSVFISICIPAYKHVEYLKRLLDSIAIQTFKGFEVVITDDSPGQEVEQLCLQYKNLPIQYIRNEKALGSPENWNAAIRNARGEWIKMMHDDDWFSSPSSLDLFFKATVHNKKFVFSAYTNVYEGDSIRENVFSAKGHLRKIVKNPMLLLPKNRIGPPSVTMIHKSISHQYDNRMKWRVDIDLYMRILETEKELFYINSPLINVGISNTQVTNSCLNNPAVELPEGLLLLSKFGVHPLKNIWIYDTWWRLIRNMQITSVPELKRFTGSFKWPPLIEHIVEYQSELKRSWLKFGILSKFFMLICYLKSRASSQDIFENIE